MTDSHQSMRPFRIGAVLFDFDDTLTTPGHLDFEHIRRELNCPFDKPILEYVASLPSEEARRRAADRLTQLEYEAAAGAEPDPEAAAVIRGLHDAGLPLGILTRNGRGAVERALENFDGVDAADFEVIVSRDDPGAPKPAADGVLLAAQRLGVPSEELLVVGDYVFDILAGRAAGAVTALLFRGDAGSAGYGTAARPGDAPVLRPMIGSVHADGRLDPQPDFVLDDLCQLSEVVRLGRPLPAGKFPSDLLERFLTSLPPQPPSLVFGPRVGRDVAAIDPAAIGKGPTPALLAVGMDPVTFPTDALGRWTVLVNVNDVATSGAVPRWLWATLLFPVGTTPSEVLAALAQLAETCEADGIALCGGHTEITDAVVRPVVSATVIGTVGKRGLMDTRNIREGDAILLTKRVAVEGTALLASGLRTELLASGMTPEELAACEGLRSCLSVVAEASLAAGFDGVNAMHDVTEGGLASAVTELAMAGGHGIRIDLQAVPYYPQTIRLCETVGAEPLGLIGSGSLLIACRPDRSVDLIEALKASGVEATAIGEVLEARTGPAETLVEATRGGRLCAWPQYEVDEVARLFSRLRPQGSEASAGR